MRGSSQPFLVRASNKACYVAKFTGNPQGSKTLINECIANHLLVALGVTTPQLAILRLGDSCQGREKLYLSTDCQTPVKAGLHLGSRCPVDPDKTSIFDLLPGVMHARLANPADIGIVLAFDAWVAHADRRQFVFARKSGPHKHSQPEHRNERLLTAWAIDNGQCFGGNWTLKRAMPTSPGSLELRLIGNLDRSADAGAEIIRSLHGFHFQAETYQQIPQTWFETGGGTALQTMLDELNSRRERLAELIQGHIEASRTTWLYPG